MGLEASGSCSQTSQNCEGMKLKLEKCMYKKKSGFDLFIRTLEKVSAVALGIFSACMSLELFIPFFFFGMAIGVYTYFQNKDVCSHSHSVSSCAHGFLEQLTGVRLPAPFSLAANIAVMICHIDHHTAVFVPIVGVSLGSWAGESACHYGALILKKIECGPYPAMAG